MIFSRVCKARDSWRLRLAFAEEATEGGPTLCGHIFVGRASLTLEEGVPNLDGNWANATDLGLIFAFKLSISGSVSW